MSQARTRSRSTLVTPTRGLSVSAGSAEKKVSDSPVSASAPSSRSFHASYGPSDKKKLADSEVSVSEIPAVDLPGGEGSPSSSPSHEDKTKEASKFKIFSPRRKSISQTPPPAPPSPKSTGSSSPHGGSFLKESHKEQKESQSSTASSPRTPKGTSSASSSPRSLKRGTPNSSPRLLKDSSDVIPLGDLPIGKAEAAFLEAAAQARIADPKNIEWKPYGLMYDCITKSRDYTKKYAVVITGAGDSEEGVGLGSTFYFLLDRSDLLGEGASAQVFMAYNLQTGERFAAKVFKEQALFHMIEAEKNALLKMKRFYGGLHLSQWMVGEKLIFTNYLPGQDLFKVLYTAFPDEKGSMDYHKMASPISMRMKMIIGAMECVAEVHKNGLIHRDIKTNNFRINCDEDVKVYLMDFDSAIPSEVKTSRIASTPGYLAPEISKEDPDYYTFASDLFSLGVVIWEMIEDERWVKKDDQLVRVNYQQSLKRKFEEIEKKEKWLHQVTRDEIIEVMDRDSLPTKCQTVEEYVYQAKIKAYIDVLIDSLMQESPAKRLKGSNLIDEIEKVRSLLTLQENLTSSLTMLVEALNAIQKMGVSLDNLKPLAENILLLSELDLLAATTAALRYQPVLNPETCIDDGLKRITELFSALKLFVKSFVVLQDLKDHLDDAFIQSIFAGRVKNEEEALAFLESVSLITKTPAFSLS